MGGLLGGPKGILAPPPTLKLLGGGGQGPGPPLPTPMACMQHACLQALGVADYTNLLSYIEA